MRLKERSVNQQIKGEIKDLSQRYKNVVCSDWEPVDFSDLREEFLSFLQKLSVLRGRDRVIASTEFPNDQRASLLMTQANAAWTSQSKPWFECMTAEEKVYPYGHWFAHILCDYEGIKKLSKENEKLRKRIHQLKATNNQKDSKKSS